MWKDSWIEEILSNSLWEQIPSLPAPYSFNGHGRYLSDYLSKLWCLFVLHEDSNWLKTSQLIQFSLSLSFFRSPHTGCAPSFICFTSWSRHNLLKCEIPWRSLFFPRIFGLWSKWHLLLLLSRIYGHNLGTQIYELELSWRKNVCESKLDSVPWWKRRVSCIFYASMWREAQN